MFHVEVIKPIPTKWFNKRLHIVYTDFGRDYANFDIELEFLHELEDQWQIAKLYNLVLIN